MRQSVILNKSRNLREKVSQLLLLYASEAEVVEELPFGSIGVILGLKHTRTGDTLVSLEDSEEHTSALRDIVPPPAVIAASVIPQSHSDLVPVQEALESLARTDPSVRIDVQEGQILVHGLGALHLEIVEGRLRDEWDAQFEFGRRRVSYRETLGSGEPGPTAHKWITHVTGRPLIFTIELEVRKLEEGEQGDPVWDGNIALDAKRRPLPSPETTTLTTEAYIARGIASTLSNSPHTSLAMSHIYVRIKYIRVPSWASPALVTGAGAAIMRNYIRGVGLGPVMEPFVTLKVSINEDALGRVVKDLTEHGGEVLDLGTGSVSGADGTDEIGGYPEGGIYIPPQWLSPSAVYTSTGSNTPSSRLTRSIHATAPLSQMLDYSNRLRASSGGHGQFEMANAGFREVSEARRQEILREIGRG